MYLSLASEVSKATLTHSAAEALSEKITILGGFILSPSDVVVTVLRGVAGRDLRDDMDVATESTANLSQKTNTYLRKNNI